MRLFIRIPLITLLFACGACGYFGIGTKEARPERASLKKRELSKVAVERAPEKLGSVEVLWQIPQEPVDGFVIKYSYESGGAERQIKVDATELVKFEDESHGFVYRYVLKEISPKKPVLVAISAYKGDIVSPPSQVFRVEAEESVPF